MTYNRAMPIKQSQAAESLLSAYLIVGEDELKRRRAIERLRKRIAAYGDLDFNHDVFSGNRATGTDIAASCNTLPFASDLRLVEVNDAEKLKKADVDILVSYLSAPSPTTVLAIISPKLAKNTRLYKAVAELGSKTVIDCMPLKRYELGKMLRSMAVGYGFTLTDSAASKLVELVGEDTIRLDQELCKISLAVQGQDPVTPRDVESLVARTAEAKPWELVNALSERNLSKCLTFLHLMSESPIRLISLCVSRLRELACAKALEQRGQGNLLAQTLGFPAWRVKNHAQWARNYSEQELRHAFIEARDCERTLKSSSNSQHAFEDWLISTVVRN